MVIEYLVTTVALTFGRKLGERWMDVLVDRADQQTRNLLKQLSDAPDDQPAREVLIAHLEEHPVEADKLIARALPHVEVVPSRLGRVRHYIWILNWVLERVHERLQRPAALPGFLNTPDCVSIFDTRPVSGAIFPRVEIHDFFDEDHEKSFDPVCFLVPENDIGIAIRLVPIADKNARDRLVSELNAEYEHLGNLILVDFPEGTRTVDAIASNRIELVRPDARTMKVLSTEVEIDEPSPEELAFCKITGTEGVIAMRDGLLAELASTSKVYDDLLQLDFDQGNTPP